MISVDLSDIEFLDRLIEDIFLWSFKELKISLVPGSDSRLFSKFNFFNRWLLDVRNWFKEVTPYLSILFWHTLSSTKDEGIFSQRVDSLRAFKLFDLREIDLS